MSLQTLTSPQNIKEKHLKYKIGNFPQGTTMVLHISDLKTTFIFSIVYVTKPEQTQNVAFLKTAYSPQIVLISVQTLKAPQTVHNELSIWDFQVVINLSSITKDKQKSTYVRHTWPRTHTCTQTKHLTGFNLSSHWFCPSASCTLCWWLKIFFQILYPIWGENE